VLTCAWRSTQRPLGRHCNREEKFDALAANVTSGDAVDWQAIDGQRVYRTVKNLRQRLLRASRQGDLSRVRSLQRLMWKSKANALESVRRVTQGKRGKSTPGIAQVVVTTPEERGTLCAQLRALDLHKVHPVRRVYIPKRNGQRPLGIPTLVDRCVQAMVKNALEPFWEARFEGISDGFRPGRGCHDAIEKVFRLARPDTTRPWVVDADIEGAVNNIGHAALDQAISHFPARELIKQWLKAGYVEAEMLHPTEAGVPQGGVIRPLLLNVALHGMEQALGISYTPKGGRRGTYALVRDADDLVIFSPTHEKAVEAQHLLSTWLGTRGLRLSGEKTPIRHLREGCNVLGFNMRHYPTPNSSRSGYKLWIKPSPDSVMQIKRKLKGLWRKHGGSPAVALINAMHPLIRGWSTYFRTGVAKEVFAALDGFMYRRAQRYMQRRHPRKSGWWRTQKYWGRVSGRQDRWVFQDKERHGTLRKFAWTTIIRHRLVPSTYSPADPTLQDSWSQRRQRTQVTTGRSEQLARRQHGRCPVCHQALDHGEEMHVHHVRPKRHGGMDDLTNFRLVHHNCHRQIHSSSAPLGVRRLLEPCTR
jgi:RNA-directed DNA polymerase